MAAKNRVVITGLGVATPIGIGIDPFWDSLMLGKSGIQRVTAFDPLGLPSQIGGALPPFKLGDHIPKSYRKSAKVMSRDIVIAVVAAYHAVTDAKLVTKCLADRGEAEGDPILDSTRFGANIGAGLVCADLTELAAALSTAADDNHAFSMAKWGEEGMSNLTPLWLLKFLPNMLACHVTIVHDARAPSNTITCAEASSHLAIGEAFRTVARGAADVCICGGAESKINPMAMARRVICDRFTTSGNDAPEQACQPFGKNRSGSVASEGGGLIILESLEHAQRRNARIYAEVTGFGASSSIQSWSKPDVDGEALALAIRKAITDADATPDDVQLVCPFGTGLQDYDASEMAAFKRVFAERLKTILAMTTRGAVGNNGAGSGAIDFAAAVNAVYRNTVPPSINTSQPDPDSPFRFVQADGIDLPITHALTAGYALAGGQCAALVISQYREPK